MARGGELGVGVGETIIQPVLRGHAAQDAQAPLTEGQRNIVN